MLRRISRKTPDSLKQVKQLEEKAKASVSTAERQAAEVGKTLGTLRVQEEETRKRLEELEESRNEKLTAIKNLDSDIEAKDVLVREAEGKLANNMAELTEVEIQIQKAVSEQANIIDEAKEAHQQTMAVYSRVQSEAQEANSELERRKSTLAADIMQLTDETNSLRRRGAEYAEIVKNIPVKQQELEEQTTLLLEKQVELQDIERKAADMSAQFNGAKSKLEEAQALRQVEEERVATLQRQLVEKEDEVDQKMKQLREVKAGVELEIARLKRKEKDFDLKKHLSENDSDVTKK